MMFRVEFDADAADELEAFRARDKSQILGAIREQLMMEPTRSTRSRKRLEGLVPPWEQVGPVWQLRVGEYRVFYDVLDDEDLVIVRAVRRKGKKTTEEIL
jgi:mRNA-degrading endonuclease RelE of RelBE toxin-antitoxin system